MSELVLAVDGGNTKTLAAIVSTEGEVLGLARGGPSDIYGLGSVDVAVTELARTVDEALTAAKVEAGALSSSVSAWRGPTGLRITRR